MDTHYCVPDQLHQMQRFNTAKYELIQSLIKAHQVDGSRVYISGASSGGGAAIRFMMQYLDLFAGAVVIAAKDTVIPLSKKYDLAYKFTNNPDDLRLLPADYRTSYKKMTTVLKNTSLASIPIWFAQAYNDHICTSYTSIMLYHLLKEQGAEHNHLTLYTDAQMKAVHAPFNHFPWAQTLDDTPIIDWLYSLSVIRCLIR